MPWNGVMSSLWNQAKLYKQALCAAAFDGGLCFICDGPSLGRDAVLCNACRADLPRRTPRLKRGIAQVDSAFAAFRYEYPITDVVKAAKFHGNLAALSLLASGFDREFLAEIEAVDFLIPVPLQPWRFMRRGFNQSWELARSLSRKTRTSLRHDVAARRHSWGRAQSLLDAAARKENVREAFRIKCPLAGASVAIVDDVITTGATCASLASALRAAGAHRIIVIAAAATPRHDSDRSDAHVSRLVTLKA